MYRRLLPIALVTLLALALVACGDDDLVGDATGSTAPGSGLPGTDDSTLPTSVGDIPGVSDECEAYVALSLAMSSAFTGGFDGIQGDLVSDLPLEARADGTIVVNALHEFSQGLADLGIDMSQGMTSLGPEQMEAFGELGDRIFTDEVNDAFDRIGEFAEANCTVGTDF